MTRSPPSDLRGYSTSYSSESLSLLAFYPFRILQERFLFTVTPSRLLSKWTPEALHYGAYS